MNRAAAIAALAYNSVPTDPNVLLTSRFNSGSVPSGWNNTGLDFTATPGLDGAFAASGNFSNQLAWAAITPADHCYGFFLWRADVNLTSDPGMFAIYDSAGNRISRLRGRSTTAVRLYNHDLSAFVTSGTSAIAVDTIQRVWWEYIKGTGADGVLHTWTSATDTKPGSPTLSITNLASTEGAGQFRFEALRTGDKVWFDDPYISLVDITGNPYA